MEHAGILQIVVASPSDVQAEREVLPTVIDELNRGVAKDRGLRLELVRWEIDAYPGFHPEGPQGLINPILQIEDCDILIGIFWKRFGTPTADGTTGTEHEFLRAYDAWKQNRRPQIMVYFNQKPATPQTREEIEQWGQGLDFQKRFPKEGLSWKYDGEAEFEPLVRGHLTQFLRQSSPVAHTQKNQGDIPDKSEPAPEPPNPLRSAYLNWLIKHVQAVPLTGVDPKSIREESRRDLDLAAVYTALMTQRSEFMNERQAHLEQERFEQGRERLSALAVLNTKARLALLGEPGSGKSTFVNFVALCMAGELLGNATANLAVLRTPVPVDERERTSEEEDQPQAWDHGALIPIRVVLREFVARGLAAESQDEAQHSDRLWQFIQAELPETLRDFAQSLQDELHSQGGLLLLDGLDEVPEADARRVQVKDAVEHFAAVFPKVRILVTSRTYAYQNQDWKLSGFAEAILAPFGQAQIRRFVERWYAFVGQARQLPDTEVQGRAVLLNNAIENNPRLYELATRPLLLTLMASLHAWRGGTLPDQREELYADAVELLLDQWEQQKVRRKADGSYEVIEPSLVEWLAVDQKVMRQFLNRLAFEAHRDQQTLLGTADIAQDKLVSGLMQLNLNRDVRPARLLEFLQDRAGVLEPRGVGISAFPHRMFQEYLAACHLTEHDDFPDNVAKLLRAEPNRWREVTLLAGAKAVRGATANAWNLADALCFAEPPTEKLTDEAGYWGALLAGQVLIENRSLERIAERNQGKLERIRSWLTCTLTQEALPSVDRALAGEALAQIDDPRFCEDAWWLPDEDMLGFVEIPAGTFLMGSDKDRDSQAYDEEEPQHELSLPLFYIARYPVTVTQFRVFVEDSGYKPRHEFSLEGLSNHPVVYVTWYDAFEYCKWLTEKLKAAEHVPESLARLVRDEGWQVSLPSEAEWEKAARGADGRVYPWGDEFDAGKANVDETGIGRTSAVGSFPSGTSPFGMLDVSGNVWEWTRSLWGSDSSNPDFSYPYDRTDGREDLNVSNDVYRVVRGGGFFNLRGLVRCAFRYRPHPVYGNYNWGFRVVVLPPLNSDPSGL